MQNDKNKIDLIQWCERYQKIKDEEQKVQYIKDILKTTYIPFVEKVALCKQSAEQSLVVNKDNIGYIDTNINEINLIGMIISLYTILDFPVIDNKVDLFSGFDSLRESGAINGIIYTIGEDIDELISVNKRTLDAIVQEKCSFPAYVSRIINTLLLTEKVMKNIKEDSKE